jgi:hypothetical protein
VYALFFPSARCTEFRKSLERRAAQGAAQGAALGVRFDVDDIAVELLRQIVELLPHQPADIIRGLFEQLRPAVPAAYYAAWEADYAAAS